MIHDWKMELYWRLPVALQEAALSLYATYLDRMYYGDGYESWRQRYREWQNWSRTEAAAWQNRQLQAIVQLAAARVPYYRSRWRDLDWRSVRSAADLSRLPLLDKQSLRQNEREFIADGIDRKTLSPQQTSGTTVRISRWEMIARRLLERSISTCLRRSSEKKLTMRSSVWLALFECNVPRHR